MQEIGLEKNSLRERTADEGDSIYRIIPVSAIPIKHISTYINNLLTLIDCVTTC